MISSQDERIRARAYAIWMEEGRPHGKHEEHWHRAAREIEQEAGGRGSTVSKAGATKAGANKAVGGNASAAASSRATPKAEATAKKSGAAKPRRNSRAPAS